MNRGLCPKSLGCVVSGTLGISKIASMSAKLAVNFLRLVFNWLSRSVASGNSISTHTVSISGENYFAEDYPRAVFKIEELLANHFHKW